MVWFFLPAIITDYEGRRIPIFFNGIRSFVKVGEKAILDKKKTGSDIAHMRKLLYGPYHRRRIPSSDAAPPALAAAGEGTRRPLRRAENHNLFLRMQRYKIPPVSRQGCRGAQSLEYQHKPFICRIRGR